MKTTLEPAHGLTPPSSPSTAITSKVEERAFREGPDPYEYKLLIWPPVIDRDRGQLGVESQRMTPLE